MMLNDSQHNSAMGTEKSAAVTVPAANQKGKRRMSLFSFGSNSSSNASKVQGLAPISTSPGEDPSKSGKLVSKPVAPQNPAPTSQVGSPVISATGEPGSLCERPESLIFERSVQDMAGQAKQEDFIPPALDATASILSDKHTDLDNVEMIYTSRRNSSVLGLNMALGRPCPPSRKNSAYTSPILASPNSSAALNSFNYGQSPPSANLAQVQSPVSPPKLVSSRSSVSFYSYADMINNDEFSRRPSLMHAYSHAGNSSVGRKMSVTSNHSLASNNGFNSPGYRSGNESYKNQLEQIPQRSSSKPKDTTDVSKFLISPESSDSEDQDHVAKFTDASSEAQLIKRRSFTSNHSIPDNESFVSTSVGDCIRQTNTEISGN